MFSVLLTNREWVGEMELQSNDRTPVYDGVVHYGEQWVFAIENKPFTKEIDERVQEGVVTWEAEAEWENVTADNARGGTL